MQIIGGIDLTLTIPVEQKRIECGQAIAGGKVVLHNLSPFELMLTFGDSPYNAQRQAFLMGWQPREFDFCGETTPYIYYSIYALGTATIPKNSPSYWLVGESYAHGEVVPISHPNYDRLSNVGNGSLSTTGSATVKNDGQPAATNIIESTPVDQASSSISWANDGSGFQQILSAGVLRTIFSFLRGDFGVNKAVLAIGDAADPSLLVVHGTADNATQAGQATTANTANTTRTIQVYDGGLATVVTVSEYQGTTDPTTYLVPSYGDRWFQG